ncbi:hypothetical protein [Microbacterium sp.]|uniref:hypothetical protein n=1 Tax=Microbacterium sp. TaxID=51671 RepID=UPI002811D767|nr:hypothetical protein [Microbacterium sp.]
MDVVELLAAEVAAKAPNLWGALGCAMAYAAALLTALDSFADLLIAHQSSDDGGIGPAHGLKFGGKLTAAGVTVVSAGTVLALDSNWFAFVALSSVFAVVLTIAILLMRRHRLRVIRMRGTAEPARPAADMPGSMA